MRGPSCLEFALLLLACAPVTTLAATPQPPATPRHAASTILHGIEVSDPYRWLEDGNARPVRQWIAAQNAYTEQVMASMPQRDAIAARVRELAITSTTRSAPSMAGETLFYLRQTPPQPQPVLVAQEWPDGAPKTLVDLNDQGGGTAISGYWPSPSGRYVAYGTAEGGAELTTIHVLEVRSGKLLDDSLAWAGGGTTPQGLAWDADEKGFVYVRFPPPAPGETVKQFDARLVHHVLGQPATADTIAFGKEYSPIAEYRLHATPDGEQLAVLAYVGDGGPADVFLRHGDRWQRVLGHAANVRGAVWAGDRLLVQSFADAPRGKLLAVDANGKVREVLGQRVGALQSVAPIANGFLVVRSWGPDWWAEQYTAEGEFVRRVALPEHGIGIGGIASESGQQFALITYSGWNLPTHWASFDASTGSLKTVFKVEPATDYSAVEAHRIDGISSDGTRIPVTVVSMQGIGPNGKRPTVLYGYGGFDNPLRPGFLGPWLAWLERGGVLAFANIRGGNEFGQAWHRGGMKLDKQNVFDDFHAAARALVHSGWTDRAHLGIRGGSNGGLLVGAALVQHPQQYRAVVANVGIFDVLRHESEFANGKYNVSEYGSVADPAQLRATLKYSPLQNVEPDTAYPAVLLTTGVNDPRVAPWQSRKFAAALQHASNSGHPVLLLTRMHAGHGHGASFSQRVGNTALGMSFLAHELDLGDAAAE